MKTSSSRYARPIAVLLALATLFGNCRKSDDYKKYLAGGPIVYTGRADSLQAFSGRYRIMLSWLLISDQTIRQATIYWNDRQDSLIVPVKRSGGVDTLKVIVPNLLEQSYTFEVITSDGQGHRSVPNTVTGQSLGTSYELTLNSWDVDQAKAKPAASPYYEADITFSSFYLQGLQGVKIEYKDQDNADRTQFVPSDPTGQAGTAAATLDKYPPGTAFTYRTMFLPDSMAIDTFYSTPRTYTPATVNAYEGNYHAQGVRNNFHSDGTPAGSVGIDDTRTLTTLDAATCQISTIANLGSYNGTVFYVKINPDNTLLFSGFLQNNPGAPITNQPGTTSTYDPSTRTFTVHYMYTNTDGSYRYMDEIWTPS